MCCTWLIEQITAVCGSADDNRTVLMLACLHNVLQRSSLLNQQERQDGTPIPQHDGEQRGLIPLCGGFRVVCAPGEATKDSDTPLLLACAFGKVHVAAALIATFGDACYFGCINKNGKTAH